MGNVFYTALFCWSDGLTVRALASMAQGLKTCSQFKIKNMKQTAMAFLAICLYVTAAAQTNSTEITKRNSWLKLGAHVGLPVGNAANYSAVAAGIELKGQLMETNHLGIGLTTGYNHFFPKSGYKGLGTLPLGAFIRLYPQSSGFFAGLDGGYSFVTGLANATGGAYLRPQLGYHNFSWNVFAFYNNIFRSDVNGGGIATAGIGATYNIRFR